jgi:hypothetical protein
MNAVGLWLVKSQAVGTGVSSVTVTGAFSADYDNYRIIYSGGTASSATDIGLKLGASITGYYSSLQFQVSSAGTVSAAGATNGAAWPWVGGASAGQSVHASFELFDPFRAVYTKLRNGQYQNTTAFGTVNGEHQVATSYSEFTLTPAAGTITGGTIRVYGFRN